MKRVVVSVLLLVASFAYAASRPATRGPHAMVASQSALASQIGVEMLRAGGNAVDAAVAVAFAMAVAFPEAGNIGGGGFMLIYRADGSVTSIDYRETAPAAASAEMYQSGQRSSRLGHAAAGVPGTVAGLEYAWKRYGSGKLQWRRLIEPAIRLAERGVVVDTWLARVLAEEAAGLEKSSAAVDLFFSGGRPLREGERLVQRQLGRTLRRIAKGGAREFYQGESARRIAAEIQAHGGLITTADLAAYRPIERAPVRGHYRGTSIVSMPPPSSGGAIVIGILQQLETFDLKSTTPGSSELWHLLIEAQRRGFADRAELFGDPDFVAVPLEQLLSPNYNAARAATIDRQRASRSEQISSGVIPEPVAEPSDTTHFTIVDRDGNCVANTYTLNDAFGAHVVLGETGIVLNNQMDDFTTQPGQGNLYGLVQGTKNAIAPHKRPLSSMSPTLVLHPDGKLWFALGGRGGPKIISSVVQVIVNVIDFQMELQAALDAPRVYHQWLPDEVQFEPWGLNADTRHALEQRGHRFAAKPASILGRTTAVLIDPETGLRQGAVDGRGAGAAIGY
jgi:gamma-glutamyltranspeptidase/glutathione hydrolase